MRSEKLLRFVLINGGAIGLGVIVGTSCIGVDYPLVAFRCNPRQEDACPDTHFCCSDDPAAEMGNKPNYVGKNISDPVGMPYFSGANNGLGTSGMCVRVDDIQGQGLTDIAAANCPIPCNPTWEADWIVDVCGPARVCCQTVALEQADCVTDDDGTSRAVNGGDIGTKTAWRPGDHATHQDPNGDGCLGLAQGDTKSAVFQDCVRQLSVADQRGFCMALGAGQTCPADQPTFIDVCAQPSGGAPPA